MMKTAASTRESNPKKIAPSTKRKPPNAGKGRVKGVPNAVTFEMRQVLLAFLQGNADKMQRLFDRVARKNPAMAIKLMLKMTEFVTPKLRQPERGGALVNINLGGNSPLSMEEAYRVMLGDPNADLSAIRARLPETPKLERSTDSATPSAT